MHKAMNKRGGPSTTAKLKAKPGKYRGLDGKIFEIDLNGRRVEPKEAEESPLPQEQQGHGDQQQQQQEEQERKVKRKLRWRMNRSNQQAIRGSPPRYVKHLCALLFSTDLS